MWSDLLGAGIYHDKTDRKLNVYLLRALEAAVSLPTLPASLEEEENDGEIWGCAQRNPYCTAGRSPGCVNLPRRGVEISFRLLIRGKAQEPIYK